MSSARYAPLPNPHIDPDMDREMEAAFDDDDEDIQDENEPLNPSSNPTIPQRHGRAPSSPATYDFENFEYANVAPPGSPPRPSSHALPNNYGNSNGYIPDTHQPIDRSHAAPQRSWLARTTASLLPSSAAQRLGLNMTRPSRVVGGGVENDGVFANVTAKPGRTIEVREGDNIYLVPEEQQSDNPPSYQTAQLDAVPPYWETTVHAPSSRDEFGEMIIDALPSGTIFSFLWNMLISISFQFVGFLLTYLLHTTHAARFGSRAGLGITLIQYGFALRARDSSGITLSWLGSSDGVRDQTGDESSDLTHLTFGTKEEAEDFYRKLNITMIDGQPSGRLPAESATSPGSTMDELTFASDLTTDWLSFFLMTIGWFILLTSLMGFWRVKRWERNILRSQEQQGTANPESQLSIRLRSITAPVRRFGGMLREGLGLGRTRNGDYHNPTEATLRPSVEAIDDARLMEMGLSQEQQREIMLARVAHDPVQHQRMVQAFRDDDELIASIRAAGML